MTDAEFWHNFPYFELKFGSHLPDPKTYHKREYHVALPCLLPLNPHYSADVRHVKTDYVIFDLYIVEFSNGDRVKFWSQRNRNAA